MIKLTNIQILDDSLSLVSFYNYSDEIQFSFEIKSDNGKTIYCKTNGYTIKSDNFEHIPSEQYEFWKEQIIDYIDDHNIKLLNNTLEGVEVKYVMTGINDDYAYDYKKYVNGELVSEGSGWYTKLEYKIEKDAWKKGVKEYKKAKRIKNTTELLEEEKQKIRNYVKSLNDYIESESSTEPPIVPLALKKMKTDPCEFISEIIQKGCQGATGLSLTELANYYIKTLKLNTAKKISNKIEEQQSLIEPAVEAVLLTTEPLEDYFDEMNVRAEEFIKQQSETVALFNYTVYEITYDSPPGEETSSGGTSGGTSNGSNSNTSQTTENYSYTYTYTHTLSYLQYQNIAITKPGELWKTIKADLGTTPSKDLADSRMKSFQIKTRDANGQMKMRSIQMYYTLEPTVKQMFEEIYNTTTFKIITVVAYSYRYVSDTKSLSNHAFGAAIDMNYTYNPWIKNGKLKTEKNKNCKDVDNDLELRTGNHPVVNILKKYGFGWGGYYNSGPDYMHFSCNTTTNNNKQLVGK